MKKIALIGLFLVSAAAWAQAATLTVGPSDCSASAVNSAIGSARNGDTILLTCSGSVSWTSTVTIPSSKGITLQVQGGTNTGTPNFPLTVVVSSSGTAITATASPGNAVIRITGFKFQNSGTSDPFLDIVGAGNGPNNLGAFRIDNNYFDTISAVENVAIWAGRSGPTGQLWGLIDHNTFHNVYRGSDTSYGPYNIQIWNYWYSVSQCWGCNGWTDNDFVYGTEHQVFIEDNTFEQTATAPAHMRHYISSELGARYVSRHNTFINNYPDNNADLHDAHGLCLVSSNGVGSRGGEIYGNTITGTGFNRAMQLRGGSWLVYNNTITSGHAIEFDEYRAESSSSCSSSSALSLMPPWPVPPGAQWSANAPWKSYAASNGSDWQLPQQIFNTFAWNNKTPTGPVIMPSVPTNYFEPQYIQNNRDYFANADGSQPAGIAGYTPYTYPHPLQGGGSSSSAPAAPTGLKVVVQ